MTVDQLLLKIINTNIIELNNNIHFDFCYETDPLPACVISDISNDYPGLNQSYRQIKILHKTKNLLEPLKYKVLNLFDESIKKQVYQDTGIAIHGINRIKELSFKNPDGVWQSNLDIKIDYKEF